MQRRVFCNKKERRSKCTDNKEKAHSNQLHFFPIAASFFLSSSSLLFSYIRFVHTARHAPSPFSHRQSGEDTKTRRAAVSPDPCCLALPSLQATTLKNTETQKKRAGESVNVKGTASYPPWHMMIVKGVIEIVLPSRPSPHDEARRNEGGRSIGEGGWKGGKENASLPPSIHSQHHHHHPTPHIPPARLSFSVAGTQFRNFFSTKRASP